jgi:3-deoxy-D-manno-octulosonic-acid transferase
VEPHLHRTDTTRPGAPGRRPRVLGLYAGAVQLATPLLGLTLRRRARRGKEEPDRLDERRGVAGAERPAGPLVWLHATSIGEANSVLGLVHRLTELRPDLFLLVTTTTVSSARLIAPQLPGNARHQFVPVDHPAWTARFLDHWRPDLMIWVESELWPNLLAAADARGIPRLLLQGRLSPKSARRWRMARRGVQHMLRGFALCLAQSPQDAKRLRALGAVKTRYLGNLKFAAAPLPADADAARDLALAVGARPCWLAASTHAGEEAVVAAVHRALAAGIPRLLTVVVPRHEQRGAEIADMLAAEGLAVARRSAGALPEKDIDIYLADTTGELGLFYRQCPVAFIGGSLVRHGGQNPLEPARLDTALLHGPHVENFREIYEALARVGGCGRVVNETEMAAALKVLLSDTEARDRMATAAAEVAAGQASVLDDVVAELLPFLPPSADATRA